MAICYSCNGILLLCFLIFSIARCNGNDILGCGGFVKSHVTLDFSKIEIGLFTKEGTIKEKTECAPTNGYYFVPLYEKGEYVLKVHPPPGWSFEPSQVELLVDGVSDQCSTGQDINFSFNGFGIAGRVITLGQKEGPKGVSVQLLNEKGEARDTVTSVGGDFHFTPVIPGKYVIKASHPRWKLEPSQSAVQVNEGNTALPIGVLAVKGYDVKGSITCNGNPIPGLYVLLYSKEENPKYRIEGCNTALLQGVPDAPICHSVSDASGEFSFGLVPAGEYKLLALTQAPGQGGLSYNIKPETVSFTVLHDSLYIKNAFEVTGFTVVGSVLTSVGGNGLASVQVILDGKPVGTTDAKGKYTLPALKPGEYTVSFKHELCEIEKVSVSISNRGVAAAGAGVATRWRVCGAVVPRARVALRPLHAVPAPAPVTPEPDGTWCTFLAPGTYTASVEVTEEELKEGLQFFPVTQKVSVGNGPVSGVSFSQLKARVSGTVECRGACPALRVALRAHSHAQRESAPVLDGKYSFENILPGTIELSVLDDRLCWKESKLTVTVTQEHTVAPAFEHTGYVIKFHSSHDIEVEYSAEGEGGATGVLRVPAGPSARCVPAAGRYVLAGRACHELRPPTAHVQLPAPAAADVPMVYFKAVAHAMLLKVVSPEPVDDLMLKLELEGEEAKVVGPLTPLQQPNGEYNFEHTIYLADGSVLSVEPASSRLLFAPSTARVAGRGACGAAPSVRARPALRLQGRVLPPLADVSVTLTNDYDDTVLKQVTSAEGAYSFGPLEATRTYSLRAHRDGYALSGPDARGDFTARRLAEITVQLRDDADGTPLQGGVVSVSGGPYRRNLGAGASGRLVFGSLAPAQYYVKPLMKEYRFAPPHHLVLVDEGRSHHLDIRGVRVAWSCSGALVALSGAGWGARLVIAAPAPAAPPHCAPEEATTDADGAFRIRGLLPKCVYSIQLKEPTAPDQPTLTLVKAPASLEITDSKDIENVVLIAVQPSQLTDTNVAVYTANVEHYRGLRLTLALETSSAAPLYSVRLDPAGYSAHNNPGLMYALPRLPADNATYVLHLESTLSKSTHVYQEEIRYFVSDGKFKYFNIDFVPKVRSSEQELRQSSFVIIPLLGVLALAAAQRGRLGALAAALLRRRPERAERHERHERHERSDVLDKASIDHILSQVNAAGKRQPKKKLL